MDGPAPQEAVAPAHYRASVGQLDDILPKIIPTNPAPDFVLEHHIRSALARDIPELRISPIGAYDDPMIIVGTGPSLADTWEDLKGKPYIMATGGAHDFLVERGIIPWAWIATDPMPMVASYLTQPNGYTSYYVASQCHPSVFDALQGFDARLYHIEVSSCTRTILEERGGNWMLVNGGSTAAMRAPFLGDVLGFRKFEFYAIDSSHKDGESHAAHAAVQDRGDEITVEIKGREFKTTRGFACQARDFDAIQTNLGHRWELKVHGDGLIPWIYRSKDA